MKKPLLGDSVLISSTCYLLLARSKYEFPLVQKYTSGGDVFISGRAMANSFWLTSQALARRLSHQSNIEASPTTTEIRVSRPQPEGASSKTDLSREKPDLSKFLAISVDGHFLAGAMRMVC